MPWLCALAVAATLTATPRRIAIVDLEATSVPAELANTLALLVPNEVRQAAPGAQVISGQEIKTMLGFERQRALLGCTNESCLAEIGAALGAEELVSGNIGRVGKTYVVVLRRMNARLGQTLASQTRSVASDREDELVEVIRRMVRDLFVLGGASGGVVGEVGTGSTAPWKYAVAVSGAALLVGGGILAGVTASDYGSEQSKLTASTITPDAWNSDRSRIQTEGRVADVLLVAGVVTAGIGGWLLLHRADATVTPVVANGFVGGALRGAF